ncbi:MAG: NADH-quinone oxidoreductase subunit D [Candidatus Thorarchaeota archaeon]|nr:NADH-quinone oxidoreductase subunit D [Candidatus Thorarchaeota archaeon]
MSPDIIDETTEIWFGPQHVSAHGWAAKLTLVGDYVVECEPHAGYFHRSAEKVMEFRNFRQGSLIMERLCMLEAFLAEYPYVTAVEQIAGLEVPERAKIMRTIMMEASRIHSLQFWWGQFSAELGFFAMLIWPWVDREWFLNAFEELSGSRHAVSYNTPGGVRYDFTEKSISVLELAIERMESNMSKFEDMLMGSPVFRMRTEGIAQYTAEQGIKWGLSGPNIKACGIPMDLRKDSPDPNLAYDLVDWDVPIIESKEHPGESDAFDRMVQRFKEVETSVDIIRQLLKQLPEGDIIDPKARSKANRLPEGEAYGRVEGTRGISTVWLKTTEKAQTPYRVKIRGPCFNSYYSLKHLVPGVRFADFIVVFGSLDPYPGWWDR